MGTGKKVTPEIRADRLRQRFIQAERGPDGLRRVGQHALRNTPSETARALISGDPIVLTSDGEEICIVMTVEDYFAMLPPEKIKWGPTQVITKGVRYREVAKL